MQKTATVILDADGLIAIFNKDDPNHQLAVNISKTLLKQNAVVLAPITALSEAITTTKWKKDRPKLAQMLLDAAVTGGIQVIDTTIDLLPIASSYFKSDDSKHNTFFDALIAACAKKHKAKTIFSFDKWYEKQGFNLAVDVIEERN